MKKPPLVLAICDGWGVAPPGDGNAIFEASTPHMDRFIREYPAMTLSAASNEVGLNFGEMGNSEVGHLNIGAGRVYYQTFPRINAAISDGSFFENSAILEAIQHVHEHKSQLHLVGLMSTGNVHASQEHVYALMQLAKKKKIKHLYLHPILDGRDTPYNSGIDFIRQLEQEIKEKKIGTIASLSGRYYAMDRDNRWDRIELAYNAIANGVATDYFDTASEAISAAYAKEQYDEEFIPIVIGKEGKPTATINEHDAVIYFNFRPDRARQLTKAFVLPGFNKFERTYINDLTFVTMTEYEKEIPVRVAYPPVVVHNSLAEVISKAGLKQYHVAETEKYAHITFFLNGTIETPFEGEDRNIIPSPQVATYDQAPEMSAPEIAKDVIRVLQEAAHEVILVNFANADMVGHTGNYEATKKAVTAVDQALGAIAAHVLSKNGTLMITADHGNAEEEKNALTGDKNKEHSVNPVPFIVIQNELRGQAGPSGDPPGGDLSLIRPVGMLADIAPTILRFLDIPQPPEMTGRSLL